MAMMTNEEYNRMKRRRFRQLAGLLVCCLVVVGIGTVISSGLGVVAALFDDTKKKQEYSNKLQCLVMLDPLPFESLDAADSKQLTEAAIWGTIYNALANQDNLDNYERDPDTDGIILPALEVDATMAKLVGPDYKITHESFESSEMMFQYLEDKQGYLIPVTGLVGQYTPQVEKFQRKDGKMYVTVGYIPTFSSTDFSFSAATEPTKYMDYVFAKTDGSWYLTSLQESRMKADNASSADSSDSQSQSDPNEALRNSVGDTAVASESGAA